MCCVYAVYALFGWQGQVAYNWTYTVHYTPTKYDLQYTQVTPAGVNNAKPESKVKKLTAHSVPDNVQETIAGSKDTTSQFIKRCISWQVWNEVRLALMVLQALLTAKLSHLADLYLWVFAHVYTCAQMLNTAVLCMSHTLHMHLCSSASHRHCCTGLMSTHVRKQAMPWTQHMCVPQH